jgi:hypothetical protein
MVGISRQNYCLLSISSIDKPIGLILYMRTMLQLHACVSAAWVKCIQGFEGENDAVIM